MTDATDIAADRPAARRSPRAVWMRRAAIVVCAAVVALAWANARMFILRRNQPGARPVVLSTYYVYHAMAASLREGRIGQFDFARYRQFDARHDPLAVYDRLPPGARSDWVNFYTLDIGYEFIVEAARLAFPSLPDNILRALALQFFADAALIVVVYFLFAEWSTATGLIAAFLYAVNAVFCVLVSFAYYYYWDIPLTFLVLGSMLASYRHPEQARGWLTGAGALLGFGVWLRGTWWPLAAFLFLVAWTTPRLRRALLVPVVVFVVVAAPQVIRSSVARGQLALSTRSTWHVAMVGLGYFPNKYGLEPKDEAVFKLTREKYGVQFRSEDYYVHDQAAKKEFMSILRNDPRFVVRSFLGRLRDSLAGSTQTSILTYLFVSNIAYRLLCLAGLVAMVLRGGEMRMLGIAAAGSYAIYVLVTCLFYFVGLAYDNVSEVALFVMFMGGIDTLVQYARRVPVPLFASAR